MSFSELSRDARLLKQIREFVPRYDVYTCGYGSKQEGVVHHFQLENDWTSWKFDKVALITHQYKRAYWSNDAVRGAAEMMRDYSFDGIIANDYETVPLALSLKPTSGVHADLHEYAPEQNEPTWQWRLFIKPFRNWVCAEYLQKCASVTVVCEGISKRYEDEFGVSSGVVWNAAPYADFSPAPVTSPLRLVHHGVSHSNRGIDLMIEAALQTKTPVTMDFFLVNTDPDYLAGLKQNYANYPQIRINDALPYADLVSTLNGFDIGVFVLPPSNFNYKMALPNKFFDFIQARLGIVVGPSPEMAKLVKKLENGEVTDGFEVEDLVKVLDNLSLDEVERWKQASNNATEDVSAENQVVFWREPVAKILGS